MFPRGRTEFSFPGTRDTRKASASPLGVARLREYVQTITPGTANVQGSQVGEPGEIGGVPPAWGL
jgi:hypothetical protein